MVCNQRGLHQFSWFLAEREENEVNEEEIDPEDFEIVRPDRMGLSRTDIKITRQSAGHDASRIVSGKLASGKSSFRMKK